MQDFRLVTRALQGAWDDVEGEHDGIMRRGMQLGIKTAALKLLDLLAPDSPEAVALVEWLDVARIRGGGVLPGSVRAGVMGIDFPIPKA